MISITNLNYAYGKQKVLNDINLCFDKGHNYIIYGKNGAGKTTLLKCLSGIVKTTQGSIAFTNLDKYQMGLALGESLLVNKLKVIEYLQFIGDLKSVNFSKHQKEIDRLLDLMEIGEDRNKRIEKLSKGTKSKVALISALIHSPEWAVLDEPFSGMDLIAQKNAVLLLNEKKKLGTTLIISTHKADLLQDFADYIYILKDGKIEKELSMQTLTLDLQDRNISVGSYFADLI